MRPPCQPTAHAFDRFVTSHLRQTTRAAIPPWHACRAMSLTRQGRHYLMIGGLQWLVDWGVVVALSHFGLGIAPSNVIGRICGAMLGYWLNGRITFAGDDTAIGRRQLLRFVTMWLCTTTISTVAITRVDDVFGLQWAWLAKPVIEATLGVAGFLLSRYWVYRR